MNVEYLKEKACQNFETAEWAEKKRYYDVSISRYYYCIYQKIIYISKKKGFYKDSELLGNSHNITINNFIAGMYEKLTDEEKLDVSNIKSLKRIRNDADYREIVTEKNAFNLAFKYSFNNINKIIDRFL
jgi:hypothetical protein